MNPLRLADRYVIRQILAPFALSMVVLSFLLMIPPIRQVGETMLARGVDPGTIARILGWMLPQAIALTIPMSLLVAVLMGLGRLSGDRELVAMQACGISLARLGWPVGLVSAAAALATAWVMIVVQPEASQRGRELLYRTLAAHGAAEIQARVFFQRVPNLVLYVREVGQAGGWRQVFLAELDPSAPPRIYLAERGRLAVDPERRAVDLVLEAGAGHRVDPERPHDYQVHEFEELVIGVDPSVMFPRPPPPRLPDLSLAALGDEVAARRARGESADRPIMEIHRKFAVPAACLVLGLLGLALGVTNRKDSRLDGFVLGMGVIFLYYLLLYTAESLAAGGGLSPYLAVWVPNLLLGAGGLALIRWRWRSIERQVSAPLAFLAGLGLRAPTPVDGPAPPPPAGWVGRTLDRYVARMYLAVLGLAFCGLLGILYVSIFLDLSDNLFSGVATGRMLVAFFWYSTPQYAYYALPIAALIATLVTIGTLTRTSELTVMKACGISLYRMSVPLLLFGGLWSGVLFGLGETVLAAANLRAEEVRHQIRGGAPQMFDVLDRRWIVSEGGAAIYHYESLEPSRDELTGVTIYELAEGPWRLARRTFARRARFDGGWQADQVWVRDLGSSTGGRAPLRVMARDRLRLEPPSYFETAEPKADRMNHRELDRYIRTLRASGLDIPALSVSLHRKFSFPLVPLVMTIIAIPFALTTGRRGALLGIGVGVVIACGYWVVSSAFAAIGSAGLLGPELAAWAPPALFAGSGAYLMLVART